MQLSVHADTKVLTKHLNRIQRKQIPFAVSVALNDTAHNARTAVYVTMRRVFSNPTTYTVPKNILKKKSRTGSLYLRPSNKKDWTAEVGIKDFGKGAALHYLSPHIRGGGRKPKLSEAAMRRSGVIGGNRYITPADVSKNKHGNVTKGTMTKILSGVKSLPGAAKGSVNRQKNKHFIMRLGGRGSETGIWERTSKTKIKKLFNVTSRQPKYRKLFDFEKIVTKTMNKRYTRNFKKALDHALRTAKP